MDLPRGNYLLQEAVVSAQLSLLRASLPADQRGRGRVLHLPTGAVRVQGRAPDGSWIVAACDANGRDLKPLKLTTYPATWAPMARWA